MQLIKEIEQDFGEPIRDVVAGFAGDGYSIAATAKILEIPDTTFRRLVQKKGWSSLFVKKGTECKNFQDAVKERPMTKKWKQSNSLNAKKGGEARAHWVTYKGVLDTITGHAKRVGISPKTAHDRYRRHPRKLDYVFSTVSHQRK